VKHDVQEGMEEVTDVMVHVDPNESDTLHHQDDDARFSHAQSSGSVHYEHDEDYLQR
jgi:hypothetical protein